jgi:hypothetical protein
MTVTLTMPASTDPEGSGTANRPRERRSVDPAPSLAVAQGWHRPGLEVVGRGVHRIESDPHLPATRPDPGPGDRPGRRRARRWLEAPIDPARFDIRPDGVDVDVRFTDVAGRVIQVCIDDWNGRRRHRGTLLARSSGARIAPSSSSPSTRGWKPAGLPPLMAAVTRLAPVFRSWPTTYRWSGTVTLGDRPTLRSRWGAHGRPAR